MALTAQITRYAGTGTERWVAGVTRHPFSAMTSFKTSAGDFWRGIARCKWTFPDGQTKYGGVVEWGPTGPCTNQPVVLTVYDGLGNSATAQVLVTVVDLTIGRDKYIASTGNDTTGDGSIGTPWQSMNKAFDDWRNNSSPPQANFGRVNVPGADTPPWTGAFPSNPDFGPLLVKRYGNGANPIMQTVDDQEVGIAASGHDDTAQMTHPVIVDGVDVTWPVKQNLDDPAHEGRLTCDHPGCAYVNATVNRAKLEVLGSGSGFVIANATVKNADEVGIGISGGPAYCVIDNVLATGNGNQATFDHEIYISSGSHFGITLCTLDGTGATNVFSGIKFTGATLLYLHRCTSTAIKNGIDSSGNVGLPNVDCVVDGHVNSGVVETGMWANYMNRVSFRNFRSYGGLSLQHVRERSYNNTDTGGAGNQVAQNVDVIGHSVNGAAGVFINFSTSLWLNWTVRNNIFVKTGNGPFFTVQQASDLANLSIDYNCYWRSGGTDGTDNFAVVGGVTKSFAEWKALTFQAGAEVHSKFADPQFVGASDLRLQDTSPCIGAGETIAAIGYDAIGTARTVPFDMGALAHTGNTSGVRAFPGAEGFGTQTPGGRGGAVLHVTNLNESGPGSLRAAVEASGPRVVVFDVSGTIDHKEKALSIDNPYITIMGHSAPGDGICLSGEELRIHTHDVIVRYLRIRTGDVDVPDSGWDNRKCVLLGHPTILGQTYNIVFDHCSFSWGVDETFTCWYDSHDVTLQWCFFYEGLMNSFHPDGPHSMGVLTGIASTNVSIHHCMIASCNQRNPQFAGNLGTYDPLGCVDFRNNLVWNWQTSPGEIEHLGNRVNIVGNWYKRGPNSPAQPVAYSWQVKNDATDALVYVAQNLDPTLDGRDLAVDNWPMMRLFGGAPLPSLGHQQSAPFTAPAITQQDAKVAAAMILDEGGCTFPKRDAADARVVSAARRRCWPEGTDYIIDSEEEVDGWPVLEQGDLPPDADHDAMPDAYEVAHGLNKNDPSDASAINPVTGYSNIEEWGESLLA